MGELFVRIALGTELSDERARAGADGWANDRKIRFTKNGSTGYAWVLTWDDRANATEFETAFRAYLDAKADRTDGIWTTGNGTAYRVVRVSNRTVTVFLGAESYVRGAQVELQNETIVVS